jgi:hypothetical protein
MEILSNRNPHRLKTLEKIEYSLACTKSLENQLSALCSNSSNTLGDILVYQRKQMAVIPSKNSKYNPFVNKVDRQCSLLSSDSVI